MTEFYVYEHWRLDREECFYVGKGSGNRAYEMRRRNRHHSGIVAKVRREGYAVEVRIVASGLAEEDAFALERERIAFWRQAGVDLANMTDGGEGPAGLVFTEESRARLSAMRKGRKISEEHRAKLVEASKGKPKSEEHRAKLAAANKGKTASAETRAKMSAIRKGRTLSEEHRAKIAAAKKGHKYNLGKRHSEETRAKMSAIHKARHAKPKWANGAVTGQETSSILPQ